MFNGTNNPNENAAEKSKRLDHLALVVGLIAAVSFILLLAAGRAIAFEFPPMSSSVSGNDAARMISESVLPQPDVITKDQHAGPGIVELVFAWGESNDCGTWANFSAAAGIPATFRPLARLTTNNPTTTFADWPGVHVGMTRAEFDAIAALQTVLVMKTGWAFFKDPVSRQDVNALFVDGVATKVQIEY